MIFELASIRRELQAALDNLSDEPLGDQVGGSRARDRAVAHVHLAYLLLTGSGETTIAGRTFPSTHVDRQ